VPSDEPGPLTTNERQLLDGFLAHDFPGVHALRVQVRAVSAKSGCTCGCGTIDLIPEGDDFPHSESASPVPVEGRVLNMDGEDVGGLLLFLRGGMLASLEVYPFGEPLSLPAIDNVSWVLQPR
jgi:hypothetical protein